MGIPKGGVFPAHLLNVRNSKNCPYSAIKPGKLISVKSFNI